jgi:hypothetical protein
MNLELPYANVPTSDETDLQKKEKHKDRVGLLRDLCF